MKNAVWTASEASEERWPLTSPKGQDTRTDGGVGAGDREGEGAPGRGQSGATIWPEQRLSGVLVCRAWRRRAFGRKGRGPPLGTETVGHPEGLGAGACVTDLHSHWLRLLPAVGSQVRMQPGDQAEAAAKVLARDTTKTREGHGALPPIAFQPRAASVKVDLVWR